MRSLLLASTLSLLPLTSMSADAPKAPNPSTGVVVGSPKPVSTSNGYGANGLKEPAPSSKTAPSVTNFNDSKGYTGAVGPNSKPAPGSQGAFTYTPTSTAPTSGVGTAGFSPVDLKAPAPPK